MSKGKEIARMVAERFAVEASPPLPPADDEDARTAADTAPVPEAQNQCEGSDCISYDFPFAGRVARNLEDLPEKLFTVTIARCPKCGKESGGFEPAPGARVRCPKCGHEGLLNPGGPQ